MKITTRLKNGVAIIKIEGELILTNSPEEGDISYLGNRVLKFLADRVKGILFDLEALQSFDSSAFGEMIRTLSRCKSQNVGFGILKPTESFSRHLEITRLNTIVEVFQDEDEAVAQVAKGSGTGSSFGSCGDRDPDGHHHFD